MTSEFNPSSNPETFAQWLDQVVDELVELGHTDQLSIAERGWLQHTWENYDLSPAEAAQSFINESPD